MVRAPNTPPGTRNTHPNNTQHVSKAKNARIDLTGRAGEGNKNGAPLTHPSRMGMPHRTSTTNLAHHAAHAYYQIGLFSHSTLCHTSAKAPAGAGPHHSMTDDMPVHDARPLQARPGPALCRPRFYRQRWQPTYRPRVGLDLLHARPLLVVPPGLLMRLRVRKPVPILAQLQPAAQIGVRLLVE